MSKRPAHFMFIPLVIAASYLVWDRQMFQDAVMGRELSVSQETTLESLCNFIAILGSSAKCIAFKLISHLTSHFFQSK